MAKVCIIGLDGGTFRVIDYLEGQGRLPNITRLLVKGSRASLLSTIPPITPAAWASFYTGRNPGNHGVVDFFTRASDSYRLAPVNAGLVNGEPFWSYASRHGKRVCIHNVPLTYPARQVNGVMISGMDAPRFNERAIFPATFRDELLAAIPDFQIEASVDPGYLAKRHSDRVGECIRKFRVYMEMEIRTLRYLEQYEDWDLFVSVMRSTDNFQHIFWDSAERVIDGMAAGEDDRRRAEAVFLGYEALDQELGRMMAAGDRSIVIMSDHGFGALKREVCLNRLLEKAGLLKFRSKSAMRRTEEAISGVVAPRLSSAIRQKIKAAIGKGGDVAWAGLLHADALNSYVDWSQTYMYAQGQFGCLFMNMDGREPQGIVRDGDEYERILKRAEEYLLAARDPEDGQPLVSRFHRGREQYKGERVVEMPDAVVTMRDHSYRATPSIYTEFQGGEIIRRPNREWGELAHTGTHRREGVLMLFGNEIAASDLGTVEMVDVAPTVLRLLGLPVPAEYDGRVLEQALRAGFANPSGPAHHEVYEPEYAGGTADGVYSEEDEEEIRKRLQDLGYL